MAICALPVATVACVDPPGSDQLDQAMLVSLEDVIRDETATDV